ncbi:membrane protein [hydrothermal vent metagenome]|uniref:Membrane protein n=1 Tax=hydrothermal vent metagenome TaxID=652676 RepID=A0A1W1C1Z9_9ZZZZ
MNKASFRANFFAVLALCFLPSLLSATPLLRNDLLKIEAVELINDMGKELEEKTGVHIYVIATNEHFSEGFNLVAHSRKYEENLTKPYVIYIFAPYATITKKSEVRGRVGIIPSSKQVRTLYDYEEVRDAGINIVAIKDSNTPEDKFNIGVLQAYSVLADNIASSKDVTLTKTIKDEMGTMIMILRILVYSGTAILLWIFMLRPLWLRRKNVKR